MPRTIVCAGNRVVSLTRIFLLSALLIIVSCGGGGGGGGGAVSQELNPSKDSFKFIILSDIHVRLPGNPDYTYYSGNLSNFSNALSTIQTNHSDAVFVITTGDNVGCLFSHDPADYGVGGDNPAERFKSMMDSLGKPYYVALGNHDYEDGFNTSPRPEGITSSDPAAMEAIWKKVLGIDPYYSFVYQGVRFIVLNSVHGPEYNTACPASTTEKSCKGSFYDAQISWLDDELQKTDVSYCLIFLHHPVITDNNSTTTWSAAGESFQVRSGDPLYAVLQTYKNKIKGIFVGHGHLKVNDTLNGTIPVYETAPIGDLNGSSGNIRIVWMDPYTGTMLTK